MGAQRTGSAKKNLPYHNTLILQKSKNLTVKDQLNTPTSDLIHEDRSQINLA